MLVGDLTNPSNEGEHLAGRAPSRNRSPGGGQQAAEGVGDGEDWRALLLPLARAQDALARLEAAAALASEAVRDGLIARVALAEAAGWLAHQGAWVSETDLALRDAGLVGAWGVASHAGRLAQEMPATIAAASWPSDREGVQNGQVRRKLASSKACTLPRSRHRSRFLTFRRPAGLSNDAERPDFPGDQDRHF